MTLDPLAIKAESERIILEAGGRICDWLPRLDVDTRSLRGNDEVRARVLAMNALINIAFEAPTRVIADWIRTHGVETALSESERSILSRPNDKLTSQELINLRWYIEALWALMWAGGLTASLPFDEHVPDTMAGMCPNVQRKEDPSKFDGFQLRSYDALYTQLDLYFRLHWYARLTGKPTPPVDLGIIMERRKALDWVLDPRCDWDSVPDST